MIYAIGSSGAIAINGTVDDVLANPKQCALDAPLMKILLVNTIRVYSVDNTKNHTECMNIFESNGIYVIIGLWKRDMRIAPVPHSSWTGCVHVRGCVAAVI